MNSRLATDAEDVRRRLTEGVGFDLGEVSFDDSSIVIISEDDDKGIMRAGRVEWNDVWYVQHLWGGVQSFLPFLKALTEELIRRGEGDRPVRWRDLSDRPRLGDAVARKVPARWVKDEGETDKWMWEITADEALPYLEDVA